MLLFMEKMYIIMEGCIDIYFNDHDDPILYLHINTCCCRKYIIVLCRTYFGRFLFCIIVCRVGYIMIKNNVRAVFNYIVLKY